jgi:hypothetical protein
MSDKKGTMEMADKIQLVIDYYIGEYDMTWADIIGVLEIIKMNRYMGAQDSIDDSRGDYDDNLDN